MEYVDDLEMTGITRVAQTLSALENIQDIIHVLQNSRTIQVVLVHIYVTNSIREHTRE